MVNNYNRGKTYKIVPNVESADEGDIYIGSTTKERLCQRMVQHRYDYKCWKTDDTSPKTKSCNLFDKYGIENCKIVLIEEVNCESKDQLLLRERYYIEYLPCVNKCIPTRTYKEWYVDNKDTVKEQTKEYRENNKCKKSNYDKIYASNNIDKIKERKVIPFYCDCGCTIQSCEKSRHFKSQKHQNYLKQI